MIGITSERKETSSSTKARTRTNPRTSGDRCFIVSLKSASRRSSRHAGLHARHLPDRRGDDIVAQRLQRLRDAAFCPFPASGIEMVATVWPGLTWAKIGWNISPVASACRCSAAMPACTAGVVTSGACTTTIAGAGPPGNACWMRS